MGLCMRKKVLLLLVLVLIMTSCGSGYKNSGVDIDESDSVYNTKDDVNSTGSSISNEVYFRKKCLKSEYEELYSEMSQLISKRADAINKLITGCDVNFSHIEKIKYDENTEGEAYSIDGVASWKEYIETLAIEEIYSDAYIKNIVLDKDYQYRSSYKEFDGKLYYVELAFTGSNGPVNGDDVQLYKVTDENYWCVVKCKDSTIGGIPVFLCQVSKCEDGKYRIVTEGILYFELFDFN